MIIDDQRYPLLVQFMSKFLFQEAAPTLDETILEYRAEGAIEVRRLIEEIDRVLASGHADRELMRLIRRHSDYVGPTGRETLLHIRKVLARWLHTIESQE